MPLWGTNTSNESKPKYLSAEDRERCFATNQGWVLRTDKGNGRFSDELIVAVNNLAAALANADITSAYFSNTAAQYTQGNANAYVTLVFNEKITVAGGSPTINVQGSTTNATATYQAGTGTNQLKFKFTVPAATQTLSIPAQSVTLAGATLQDESSTDSNLAIGAGVVRPVQGKATGSATVAVA